MEIAEKMGIDLKDKQVLAKIKSSNNISDETIEIFSKKKTITKEKVKRNSNLFRFIKHFSDEVPESIRNDFIEYIKNLDNIKFDISKTNYLIEEFGENILKGLYLWNPDEDIQITKNYKYFFEKYENEIMTKDLIIAQMKNTTNDSTDKWNFDME
jgi:hypothetical protein